MTKICKKCDVEMDVLEKKDIRRGNETKNVSTKYYCPKCDHSEYENQ